LSLFFLFVRVIGIPEIFLVFREVVRGFSEEARIRGFPSPPLGEFGFVVDYGK
jgi:hypothetical protein